MSGRFTQGYNFVSEPEGCITSDCLVTHYTFDPVQETPAVVHDTARWTG